MTAPPHPVDRLREWFGRFVVFAHDEDLDLCVLWTAHTRLIEVFFTTPRLVVDSLLPESGKTTVLDHMRYLALDPIQLASLSSPAHLTRMLAERPRTILIDEVDRALDPKKEGVGEITAVLNTGYKRGATRGVLVPAKEGGWVTKEMPTFAAVAMAGITPHLPDDTVSRTVRINLLPDIDGAADDSDWEEIEPLAEALALDLAAWADEVAPKVKVDSFPVLPEGTVGRMKEKWRPLKRVAVAAGRDWPDRCDALIVRDLEERAMEREEGGLSQRAAALLLRDLAAEWPPGMDFWATSQMVTALQTRHPGHWSADSSYGKALTAQRLGQILGKGLRIYSTKDHAEQRGYSRAHLLKAWKALGITPPP